jgi:hypothetical protein
VSFDLMADIFIVNLVDKQRDNFNSYAKIDREDMDALKRLGRMAAEGIIKDDDPVWK